MAITIVQMIYKHNPEFTDYERIEMQYGLECFLHEFMKIVVLLVVFGIFSFTCEYMTVLAFMFVLRPVLGGYHSKTALGCYLESFVFIGAVIFLGLNFPINIWVKVILAVLSIVFAFLYAPVDHPDKPNNDINLRKRLKKLSVVVIIAAVIISCILPEYYKNIGFFAVIGVVLLALMGKVAYNEKSLKG